MLLIHISFAVDFECHVTRCVVERMELTIKVLGLTILCNRVNFGYLHAQRDLICPSSKERTAFVIPVVK